MNKAYVILEEMKINNIVPDSFTYSTLIKGIKNSNDKSQNNLDLAFKLVNDLLISEVNPDEILFNCLIDACVKFNNLTKAEDA
jgi:pentatricopeptide repeat domain-containing protein 1